MNDLSWGGLISLLAIAGVIAGSRLSISKAIVFYLFITSCIIISSIFIEMITIKHSIIFISCFSITIGFAYFFNKRENSDKNRQM